MRVSHRRIDQQHVLAAAVSLAVGAMVAPTSWAAVVVLDGAGNNSTTATPTGTTTASGAVYDRLFRLGGDQQTLLNPIGNLMNATPNATRNSTAPVTYDTNRIAATQAQLDANTINGNNGAYSTVGLATATDGNSGDQGNLMVLQRAQITLPAGNYTFGTRSDDGSVLYVDLNNDGAFEQADGELIVNNNNYQGYGNVTGNLTASGGTYNAVIGFFQGTCCNDNGLEVRFGAGLNQAYNTLAVLNPSTLGAAITGVNTSAATNVKTGTSINVTGGSNNLNVLDLPATYDGLTMAGGTTLNQRGASATFNTFSGAGAVTLNAETVINLPTGIGTGLTAFNKGGGGTLNLGAATTANAAINVTGGRLAVNADGALGTGNVSANGGQVFLNGDATNAGPLSINGDFNSQGALRAETSRTYGGPISLAGNAMIGTNNGANLTLTGGINNNGAQLRLGGGSEVTIASNGITGGGGLLKTEGGQTFINAASNYTGATDVNGGNFNINAPLSGTSAINVNNGATVNSNNTVNSGAVVSVTNGTYHALTANSIGAGGTTTVAGTLRVAAPNANAGGAPVTNVTGGGVLQFDAANTSIASNTVNLNNSRIKVTSGNANIPNTDIVAVPLVSAVQNVLIAAQFDPNNPGINPDTVGNVNTFATTTPERTAVLSGALKFANDGEFQTFFGAGSRGDYTNYFKGTYTASAQGAVTFRRLLNDDGAAIGLDTNNDGVYDSVVYNGCCNNTVDTTPITLNPGDKIGVIYLVRDTGGGGSLEGQFSDPTTGGFIDVNPGAQAGKFSSVATTGGGFITLADGTSLAARSATGVTQVDLGNGAIATLGGGSPTNSDIRIIHVTGNSSNSTLSVLANHSLTVQSLNLDAGVLSKSGAGKLLVDGVGTGPGSVLVSQGILGGHGTIAGSVEVGNGGSLAPGNSIGTIRTGALSLDGGSTYAVEISGSTVDLDIVNGGTTLGGGNLTLSLLSSPIDGQSYTIIDGTAPVSGTFAQGNTISAGGFNFAINYAGGDGNDVVLTAHAVPEPASLTVLGLAGIGLLARRRRGA